MDHRVPQHIEGCCRFLISPVIAIQIQRSAALPTYSTVASWLKFRFGLEPPAALFRLGELGLIQSPPLANGSRFHRGVDEIEDGEAR